jgi:hypothetical protein
MQEMGWNRSGAGNQEKNGLSWLKTLCFIYISNKNMSTGKKHFFLKLNPPRPSFTKDMSEEERNIMQKHVAYWAPYVNDGTVIVLGPVMDPKGGYGVAVVEVENDEQLDQLITNDPANGLNSYEIYPMRAVTKQQ